MKSPRGCMAVVLIVSVCAGSVVSAEEPATDATAGTGELPTIPWLFGGEDAFFETINSQMPDPIDLGAEPPSDPVVTGSSFEPVLDTLTTSMDPDALTRSLGTLSHLIEQQGGGQGGAATSYDRLLTEQLQKVLDASQQLNLSE